jgi:hypothetical protein
MRKLLVIGIALSLVLVSGGLFSAQADCGCLPNLNPCGINLSFLSPCNWNFSALSPCNWHFPSFCGFGCGTKDVAIAPAPVRDTDKTPRGCGCGR